MRNVLVASAPILLFDGECGLCDRSVQTILRNDQQRTLRFAALQGVTASDILSRHGLTPEPGQGFSSMILVLEPNSEREQVLLRSEAALAIGRYLGGRWRALSRFGQLIPRTLRDLVYRLIARNRKRLFAAPDACKVPAPEERARFLP